MTSTPTYLLRGIAGSTAHGLATESSDQDLLGVFAWPTVNHLGLDTPQESLTGHTPQDYAYHELSKFLRLALKANPTVLELLWMTEYVEQNEYGNWLREQRTRFLSTDYVRDAFGGYANAQVRKATLGDNPTYKKTKNIRHMFRLLEEGMSLLTTGDMTLKVADRDWYLSLDGDDIAYWGPEFDRRLEIFMEATSVLPDKPDTEWANQFLITYREAH